MFEKFNADDTVILCFFKGMRDYITSDDSDIRKPLFFCTSINVKLLATRVGKGSD